MQKKEPEMPNPDASDIAAYEGSDMIGYMLRNAFSLPQHEQGTIRSMTNIRDTAIIVTDFSIWRAKPSRQIGFCIELVARF